MVSINTKITHEMLSEQFKQVNCGEIVQNQSLMHSYLRDLSVGSGQY